MDGDNSMRNGAEKRASAFDKGRWTDEEKRFCAYVDAAMRERHSMEFNNDNTFHALHLIYRFFLNAAKEMRIFSGMLRCHTNGSPGMKIYADEYILGAVGAFLAEEGTSLRVVVEKGLDDGLDHPLVKKIKALKDAKELRGSCEIAQLAESCAKELKYRLNSGGKNPFWHMIIMDQSAYRLEAEESEGVKAQVSFNAPDTAKSLISFFDGPLWAGAMPEPLFSESGTGAEPPRGVFQKGTKLLWGASAGK